MPRLLRAALRRELRRAADPDAAHTMKAQLKCEMPFYGVSSEDLTEIVQRVFPRYPLPTFVAWKRAVLDLWRTATHREERYAAIGLCGYQPYDAYQTMRALPIYEEMITTGAWWDYVDTIASDRLGLLLRRYPAAMRARMQEWSRSGDIWRRRAAILCQLQFKEETDLGLLYACVLANARDTQPFIGEAIGEALREYAWTDPDEVLRFVEDHQGDLSPVSRYEALRNFKKLTSDQVSA